MTNNNLVRTASGLTNMQEMFVQEYLVDLNATAAWIRAGGDPAMAARVASKMLKPGNPVATAVARAMAARSARVGVTAERVLDELGKLAFGDPRVLFNPDGSLRPPSEYSKEDAAMIAGIKTRRIVEIARDEDGKQKLVPVEIQEVTLVPKTKPLDQLMRHLGMNNDKLDVTINLPLAERMMKARQAVGMAPGVVGEIEREEAIEGEYEVVDENAALMKKIFDV